VRNTDRDVSRYDHPEYLHMDESMKLFLMFALSMPCPTCEQGYPKEIVDSHREINRIRSHYGYPLHEFDRELHQKAQQHAEWMARYHAYEHSGVNNEIIYRGPTSARDAFDGYWYSPAHFNVIMSGERSGHGHAVNNGVHYWATLVSSEEGIK